MRCLRFQEVINESKLLARKLNEANQKINRKDSCLTRIQVNTNTFISGTRPIYMQAYIIYM